jgi:hypothetical protein
MDISGSSLLEQRTSSWSSAAELSRTAEFDGPAGDKQQLASNLLGRLTCGGPLVFAHIESYARANLSVLQSQAFRAFAHFANRTSALHCKYRSAFRRNTANSLSRIWPA